MRIGVDAMGGDFAPEEPVAGALDAEKLLSEGDRIVLIGEESAVRAHLRPHEGWERFIDIAPASQVIGMDEVPVETLRAKPDSSIARMAALAAASEVDAVISAGNTGACVAAAQMRLRRLRGVHRPGIAIVVPTFYGPVTLCDVGANVNCRPIHLYQYAVMTSEYSRHICGVDEPRVGLLSIGQEDAKGTQLVKETRELLRSAPDLDFIGNVEGRDLFHGGCDVVVTEGFVGNVALKLMEGLAEGLFQCLLGELRRSGAGQGQFLQQAVGTIRDKYDFNEYGGAPLLGVNGVCIICHGASQRRGLANAVRVARDIVEARINERITERIAQCQGTVS